MSTGLTSTPPVSSLGLASPRSRPRLVEASFLPASMARNVGEITREELAQDMGHAILEAMKRFCRVDLGDGDVGVDDAFVVDILRIKLIKEIGKGKNGSVVYLGQTNDFTEVAVKRFLKGHIEVDSQIINFLSINPHPNVCAVSEIKYNRHFGYIVQQLCHFTLLDLIDALNPSSNLVVNPVHAQPVVDYKVKQKALRDAMQTRRIELWAYKADGYPSERCSN